ncbi:MAG: hypothetical protein GQ534_12445 [Candidatus Delongbacteria bacterium]|nr:hypothetical protein [Candidatus Delongbacteria bacterium]
MKYLNLMVITLVLVFGSCAYVPKQAVELSATVGRDISEIKKSHIAFINLYYTDLLGDINEFIDNVYLPYQIQKTLENEEIRNEMLSAIESASSYDPTGNTQKESFEKIKIFLQIIQEEVETYRKLKLKPVQEQFSLVLANVDQSYEQVHYANSIVTGHLASVVKVHETQNEILSNLEISNIRIKAAEGISDMSEKIGDLVQKAQKGEGKLDEIISKFEKLVK